MEAYYITLHNVSLSSYTGAFIIIRKQSLPLPLPPPPFPLSWPLCCIKMREGPPAPASGGGGGSILVLAGGCLWSPSLDMRDSFGKEGGEGGGEIGGRWKGENALIHKKLSVRLEWTHRGHLNLPPPPQMPHVLPDTLVAKGGGRKRRLLEHDSESGWLMRHPGFCLKEDGITSGITSSGTEQSGHTTFFSSSRFSFLCTYTGKF